VVRQSAAGGSGPMEADFFPARFPTDFLVIFLAGMVVGLDCRVEPAIRKLRKARAKNSSTRLATTAIGVMIVK
jgi:hypothetical protein